jgi:cytochrome c peroxidase
MQGVLEFYNSGGGVGVGLNLPTQKLSSTPLKLQKSEIEDIIQFLYSLTDTYTPYSLN